MDGIRSSLRPVASSDRPHGPTSQAQPARGEGLRGLEALGFRSVGSDGFERPAESSETNRFSSAQVVFWNLTGRLDTESSRAQVATELAQIGGRRRLPEVVTVTGSSPDGLAALHREHLGRQGYHLVVPGSDGALGLWVRGRPVGPPTAWQRKVDGGLEMAVMRQTVELSGHQVAFFNVDVNEDVLRSSFQADVDAVQAEFGPRIRDAKQARNGQEANRLLNEQRRALAEVESRMDAWRARLGSALRDFVEAHRLKNPDQPVVMTGNFVRAFDPEFFGPQGFGDTDRAQGKFFAAGQDLLHSAGRGAQKLSKADRFSTRYHVEHGTEKTGKQHFFPRGNIFVDPKLLRSNGVPSYVRKSFNLHPVPTEIDQHRPISIQLNLEPLSPEPSDGKLVAPGVRISHFTRGPLDRLSEEEQPGRSLTYRVPGKFSKRELEQAGQLLRTHEKRVQSWAQQGRFDILERLPAPSLQSHEWSGEMSAPFDWSDYRELDPKDAVAELKRRSRGTERISFTNANRIVFHHLFNAGSRVTEPFDGTTVPVGPLDDHQTFNNIINLEHIWPRSKGADAPDAHGDLHLLVPMASDLNARRGNHPYGEVQPGTETWSNGSSKSGLDAEGRTVFEPPESMRGWIARAMLWSALRHGAHLSDLDRETYVRWSHAHPPSPEEQVYTARVSVYQGNRNPFVDMPEAAFVLAAHLGR